MKKSFYIFLVFLFMLAGCKKQANLTEAKEIYVSKGLTGYIKYVRDSEQYFEFHDDKKYGATPLLLAVRDCNLEAIDLFYKNGANLYQERDYNNNDFFDYLKNHTIQYFEQIIDVIPSLYWSNSSTPDTMPIIRLLNNPNSSEYIQVLLEKDLIHPELDVGNDVSLLMYAAKNSNPEIVEKLCMKSISINTFNKRGLNAVMFAARYNPDKAVLDTLLQHGASVEGNPFGFSLTMLAACNDNPGVLLAISKTEENLNKRTIKGKTALMYACENCKTPDTIEILINDFNEDVAAQDDEGKTALDYLSSNKYFDGYNFTDFLKNEGKEDDNE